MPGGPGSPLSPCNDNHLANEPVQAFLWVFSDFTDFKIVNYLLELYMWFVCFLNLVLLTSEE